MVGNGPAAIGHYLLIIEFSLSNCPAEYRDGMADIVVLGERTAPAEIGECPAAVFDETLVGDLFGDFD